MNSMTGYGRGELSDNGLRCVVECSSVNRKGAEVNVQLPRELLSLEFHIREEVLSRISRGRVTVVVAVEQQAGGGAPLIDRNAARMAAAEIRALQSEFSLDDGIPVATLLAFPGVLQAPTQRVASHGALVGEALDIALDEMLAMRQREGDALANDLQNRIASLRKMAIGMRSLAPQVTERYRALLCKRLADAHIDIDAFDTRLLTEIALFAERCDISEELTRIESHFDQFEEKLGSTEPSGRALEFLAQEIFRELNTLGSKAGESSISRLVVESKVELDKIREQSLNVE